MSARKFYRVYDSVELDEATGTEVWVHTVVLDGEWIAEFSSPGRAQAHANRLNRDADRQAS